MALPTLPGLPGLKTQAAFYSNYDPGTGGYNDGAGSDIFGGGGDAGFGGGFGGSGFGNPFFPGPGIYNQGGPVRGNPGDPTTPPDTGGITIGGVAGKVIGTAAGAAATAIGIPAINWGRIAAFLLGLLLIAGGLYLIKPVQTVIHTTVKRGARAIAEGSEVAA